MLQLQIILEIIDVTTKNEVYSCVYKNATIDNELHFYSRVYYRNAAIGVNLLVVNKRSYMMYKTQLYGDL